MSRCPNPTAPCVSESVTGRTVFLSLLSESLARRCFRLHRPLTPTAEALFWQMLPTSSMRVTFSALTHEKYELLMRRTSWRRRDGGSGKEVKKRQARRPRERKFFLLCKRTNKRQNLTGGMKNCGERKLPPPPWKLQLLCLSF